MIGNPADANRSRPQPPNGFWVSTSFATFGVQLDDRGSVAVAPPIARWSVGKRFTVLHRWARRKDPMARFAWLYADGRVGDVWR